MKKGGGLPGCHIDDTKFSQPMPWIGLGAAAASLVQSITMSMDDFYGFHHWMLWFPRRFFSLNVTSLTLLSVNMILLTDLNTSMPRRQDQLVKLSGTVLICTAMGNLMPSLGTMEGDSQIRLNVVALGILVSTLVLNVFIQIGTGLIYAFLPEHAIILFFILLLFVILGFLALIIPTTKQLLEQQYNLKRQQALGCDETAPYRFEVEKLKDYVKKYWIMAHTCNPQHVVGRSVLCTASGALCLLGTMVFLEAWLRSLLSGSLSFCDGISDYKWSSRLVLISQTIGVGVGTVAPGFRFLYAISLRRLPLLGTWNQFRDEFRVERYWVQRLVEWKDRPLPFNIPSRYCRKLAHVLKNPILDIILKMQIMLVLLSKSICFASVLIGSWLKNLFSSSGCCKISQRNSSMDLGSSGLNPDLRDFVLHLDGEEELVQSIVKFGCMDAEKWIHMGTKKQPAYLMDLLKKWIPSQGFNGLDEFDSNGVPSLGPEEPPNCWGLTLVTLTSIAIAISCGSSSRDSIKPLILGVDEGLQYVRLVEKTLDVRGLTNALVAADVVWLGIDLYNQWLDLDLRRLGTEEKNAQKILEKLTDAGKEYVEQSRKSNGGNDYSPLEWPIKAFAGNSLYRISLAIRQGFNDDDTPNMDELVERLQAKVANVFSTCLTNLALLIFRGCHCSAIELREKSVLEAAYLLGKTENILRFLGEQEGHVDQASDQNV